MRIYSLSIQKLWMDYDLFFFIYVYFMMGLPVKKINIRKPMMSSIIQTKN